jgi:hypothetical protein
VFREREVLAYAQPARPLFTMTKEDMRKIDKAIAEMKF